MEETELVKIFAYVGAAISMGLAAIGPAFGLGYAGGKACQAITRQPKASDSVIKMMLVGQAVTETSAIFGLLVAFILIFATIEHLSLFHLIALVGAGVSMGGGALGPGIGAGLANGAACEGVGRQPENEAVIFRTMLIGQAVSQSTAIYALVIAFCLIFVV